MDEIPLTIGVPDAVLDDLDRRLEATRWPGEIPGRTGTTASIRAMCRSWYTGAPASIGKRRKGASTPSITIRPSLRGSEYTSSTSQARVPIPCR